MSEKYEDLACAARCLAGSTATANWNAANAAFQMTCTPYKVMEITEDFDRVTAESDAALEKLAALEGVEHARDVYFGSWKRTEQERDALQALLTATDERADVLEGLLRHFAKCADVRQVGTAAMDAVAALKPAEGGGDE